MRQIIDNSCYVAAILSALSLLWRCIYNCYTDHSQDAGLCGSAECQIRHPWLDSSFGGTRQMNQRRVFIARDYAAIPRQNELQCN